MSKLPPIGPDTTACWCGSRQWTRVWNDHTFGLIRCGSCGTFRIDPPPLAKAEDASTFYTDYYANVRHHPEVDTASTPARGSRFWAVVRNVPELAPAGDRVADIGCGDGGLCAELKAHGWKSVVGTDVSRARISRARERYPDAEFFSEALPDTSVPRHSFDLMVMDNVVEHLVDPVEMLAQLRIFLKPGGKFVVITPNMECGHFRLLGRRWTPELAPHAHVYLFTPASLRQLLVDSGYRVETVGNFHLPAYSLRAWVRRLLSGDVKGALWRAGQETGGLYGRMIGSGPMLYAVTSRASADLADA